MKKTILPILLVFLLVTLFSCKKKNYDTTMQSIYGNYTLKSYTVDNLDSLSLYKNHLGTNISFYKDNADGLNYMKITGPKADSTFDTLTVTWDLANKNDVIKTLSGTGAIGTGPFGKDKNPEWLYILLENEIQLGTTWKGKEYYADLKK